jgi:5-methylcytosine-specific restriction enzyme A
VHGKLVCEVCDIDFAVRYGDRGKGFMECHHVKPIATLVEGQKTQIDDLALICANCHRMIHRSRPWLSVAQIKNLMDEARRTGSHNSDDVLLHLP